MKTSFIVSGTDTDVGKTVCAALLTLALDGCYWKPIQSGLAGETDTQAVRRLTSLPADRFLPEVYRLREPLSPHRAAELDGVTIDLQKLTKPATKHTLVIEGAGGLMVPVTRARLMIELFREWDSPVILCTRTSLGTINHTLLSIGALHQYEIDIHGLVFNGPDNPDTMRTIADFSGCRILGHIPPLSNLDADNLQKVFRESFDQKSFAA